jgi:regulatory protein
LTVSIEKRRGFRNRFDVLIDGERVFTASKKTLAELDIEDGSLIDDLPAAIALVDGMELESAMERSYYYLDARMRSGKELRDNLLRAGYSQNVIEQAMETLERLGFWDDKAFAQSFARSKLNSKSMRAVLFELKQKGISSSLLEEVKEMEEPDDEAEKCLVIINRYLRGRGEPKDQLRKATQACLRRGYSWDAIRAALSKADAETEEDVFD